MTGPDAVQPSLPGIGPDECRRHVWLGRGRWKRCASCWWRGWFAIKAG